MRSFVNACLLSALMSCFVLAGFAAAQGFCMPCDDDGLRTGDCCDIVAPNIPSFPNTTVQSQWACYQRCAFNEVPNVTVSFGAPGIYPPACDIYNIQVNVMGPTPATLCMMGTLYAKYSRTWIDQGPDGSENQIWRFLVNGDFFFDNDPTNPCTYPPCHLDFGKVHFVGHIDYFCCLQSPTGFGVAYSLSHTPGCVEHDACSARQLPVGHPSRHDDTSYHLVGPSRFTFGGAVEPRGPITNEAIRSTDLYTAPHICYSEYDVIDGAIETKSPPYCLCIGGPGDWIDVDLRGCAFCPTDGQISSYSVKPNSCPSMPTGMIGLKLGNYCDQQCYPWMQNLTVYWGALNYRDICPTSYDSEWLITGVGTSHHLGRLFKDGSLNCCFVDLNTIHLASDIGCEFFSAPSLGGLVFNLNPQCTD